jgi:hypothetical protein
MRPVTGGTVTSETKVNKERWMTTAATGGTVTYETKVNPVPLAARVAYQRAMVSNACLVDEWEDGAVIHLRIDKNGLERLKRKAYQQDVSRHVYENVLRPALEGYLY